MTIRNSPSPVPNAQHGFVLVISAPSGAGKWAVLSRVMDQDPNLEYCISATTRAPRPGEIDGKDYYFMDRAEFMHRVEAGEFVEWAHVHGRLYGTLRSELTRRLSSGKDVVLELDVQGMRNFTAGRKAPSAGRDDTVTVFIMAPSLEVLEQRLRTRGTNSEDDLVLRLRNARAEIAAKDAFDYIIVNDKLEEAVADLKAIIRARRCRSPQN